MNCEELREMYELYALGILEPEEKAEIETHLLRGCDACRTGVRDALALNSMMLSLTPEVVAPVRLKRRLLTAAGMERPGWGWWAAIAAALLLMTTLWLSVQERRRETDLADARQALQRVSGQRDRAAAALSFLNQPETRSVGFGKGEAAPPKGNVFVNPRSGVLLIASNLPALDPTKAFELWVITKAGAKLPAGVFQADASGTTFYIHAGPLDLATLGALAVTVEPAAGSQAPTTTPIVVAPVSGL